MKELHVILVCDKNVFKVHKNVFPEVPVIAFKKIKDSKSHLARAVLPDIKEVGRWELYGGKRILCQLSSNMNNTSSFKSKHSNEVYQMKKNFNCNFKMVVYLIECRVCEKQYTMIVTRQKFVLESITIKTHIVIFGKNKNYQTKPLTRNASRNIICRMTITGFVAGRSQ